MKVTVIIPARMASTRFPGKPLADICGKPMIQWVYERTSMAKGISRVIVATCDSEIIKAVEDFGGEAAITSDTHRSGTDRIAEVAANLDAEIIINVQGDEPLIDPASIEKTLEPFESGEEVMASLMVPISYEEAQDPNLVKVVTSLDGYALYFSRAAIPSCRNTNAHPLWRGHVGVYAYTREFLLALASWEPTPLEKMESLEQLRVLERGHRIKMVEINDRPMGVDTPEDLERVQRVLEAL
ncbi:MAG: 3-deoxy-manno-octulosonate cytidylyltransferase [Armatimonadetes bacterium]|nr:3-deoxy-manno-octulosonate cytidylyltransferase [Armatimonadota bacterium]